ncbi:MAG: SpoIIE family protein phosphatase [Leptospiraceae bacterium]|nr:SpoIIE family protein phosphatase [Leptospiraceae bacterium]
MTIRQKLFAILGFSQIFLVFGLITIFVYLVEFIKDEPQNKRAIELSSSFQRNLVSRENTLKSLLHEMLINPRTVELLDSGIDNRKVFQTNKEYFDRIMRDYSLSILEIGDKKGIVKFRFHRPEDFGDNKSSQPIIQEALKGNITSTLEVGHSGLGLRVTAPMHKEGTILLGQVVDRNFLAGLTGSKDTRIAIYEGQKLLVSSDDTIQKFLQKNPNPKSFKEGERYKFDNSHYFLATVPYGSNHLSSLNLDFVVMIDETQIHSYTMGMWKKFAFVTLIVLGIVLFISYLFSKDIIKAIKTLNAAMKTVESKGEEVIVDTKRKDEIGEMGKVFLSMKNEIFSYQHELEAKVDTKTKELKSTLDEVTKLKEHQDGDYFLTSLLIKPLIQGSMELDSLEVSTIIKQKKKFTFKNKESEIGGDLCVTQKLILRDRDYCVFLNSDAMGKSIQGAGGALVIGTVFKAILTRTETDSSVRNKFPERWLKDCHEELQNVFLTFDGTMLVSAVIGLIDIKSGTLYYINAEHPWIVLYRDNKAEFLENELSLHKIGINLDSSSILIKVFQLEKGDIIFVGSDGRDDLQLASAHGKMMNEDENEFLNRVNEAQGDLDLVEQKLKEFGSFTDDFSLMKILFKGEESLLGKRITTDEYEKEKQVGKTLFKEGQLERSCDKFQEILELNPEDGEIAKILIKLHLKLKNYYSAQNLCYIYLEKNPSDNSLLYLLSYCLKQQKDYFSSIDYGERLRLREPENVPNIINLSEAYYHSGKAERASFLLNIAKKLEPDNSKVSRLVKLVELSKEEKTESEFSMV